MTGRAPWVVPRYRPSPWVGINQKSSIPAAGSRDRAADATGRSRHSSRAVLLLEQQRGCSAAGADATDGAGVAPLQWHGVLLARRLLLRRRGKQHGNPAPSSCENHSRRSTRRGRRPRRPPRSSATGGAEPPSASAICCARAACSRCRSRRTLGGVGRLLGRDAAGGAAPGARRRLAGAPVRLSSPAAGDGPAVRRTPAQWRHGLRRDGRGAAGSGETRSTPSTRGPRIRAATGDGYVVDGDKSFCSGARDSDRLIISALDAEQPPGGGGDSRPIARASRSATTGTTWASARPTAASVTFRRVRVADDEILRTPGPLGSIWASLRPCLAQPSWRTCFSGLGEGALDEARALHARIGAPLVRLGRGDAPPTIPTCSIATASCGSALEGARALADEAARAFDRAWARGDASPPTSAAPARWPSRPPRSRPRAPAWTWHRACSR